jgi:hypothetical protein
MQTAFTLKAKAKPAQLLTTAHVQVVLKTAVLKLKLLAHANFFNS